MFQPVKINPLKVSESESIHLIFVIRDFKLYFEDSFGLVSMIFVCSFFFLLFNLDVLSFFYG